MTEAKWRSVVRFIEQQGLNHYARHLGRKVTPESIDELIVMLKQQIIDFEDLNRVYRVENMQKETK